MCRCTGRSGWVSTGTTRCTDGSSSMTYVHTLLTDAFSSDAFTVTHVHVYACRDDGLQIENEDISRISNMDFHSFACPCRCSWWIRARSSAPSSLLAATRASSCSARCGNAYLTPSLFQICRRHQPQNDVMLCMSPDSLSLGPHVLVCGCGLCRTLWRRRTGWRPSPHASPTWTSRPSTGTTTQTDTQAGHSHIVSGCASLRHEDNVLQGPCMS